MTRAFVTVFIFFCCLSASLAQKAAYPFHISVTGNGKQPVLLIPGFSCSGKVWDETIQHLPAEKYTFHTITFPGFAGQPPQANPDVQQWMADVATYISKEKLNKPVVIGHSMGGVMALWLGAMHPDMISRIVVVDAVPSLAGFYDSNFKADPSIDCSMYGKQFAAMTDQQFMAMQRQGIKSLLADTAMQGTVVNWAMQSDRNTLGLIYCQFLHTDMRGKLSTIKCPTLVLLEPSFKDYDAQVRKQYAGLSPITIRYADKGLHFLMYDSKDWYMNEVQQFCR